MLHAFIEVASEFRVKFRGRTKYNPYLLILFRPVTAVAVVLDWTQLVPESAEDCDEQDAVIGSRCFLFFLALV